MEKNSLQKILYVEDEPDIAAIARIALEEIGGFTLKNCSSAKEGLKEAVDFKPDLFLVDVMMPEMDGPSMLKEIRKIPEFKDTPVIFMTAKTQAHEIKGYLADGALDVITKPFDPIHLAEVIKTIWKQRK